MTGPTAGSTQRETLLIGDGPVCAIGDFVSRFGPRRAQPAVVADVAAPTSGQGPVFPTDEGRLRYRSGDCAREKRRVLQSLEMTKLFEPLTIVDSVLLTSRMREMVFRRSPKATGTG